MYKPCHVRGLTIRESAALALPLLFLKKRRKRHVGNAFLKGISLMGFLRDASLKRWFRAPAKRSFVVDGSEAEPPKAT